MDDAFRDAIANLLEFWGGDEMVPNHDDADAMKAEMQRLRQSVIEMRQLLDEFWKTCTEEHNSVEMFVLHRATGHAIARAYDAVPEEADRG